MKRILVFALTALIGLTVLWLGCEGEGTGQVDGIAGTVTYQDGVTPVFGAMVIATSTSAMCVTYIATSGYDGKFTMTGVADATYQVTADKGPFHAEGQVTVSGGKSPGGMVLELDVDPTMIGVVPGSFDDIGAILDDLGYEYTTLYDADLADSSNLDPLALLFLNCGSDTSYASDTTVQDNLKNYVNGGGYLYASDWDFEYIEACWPTAITFYGTDPYIGEEQTITADVVDPDLAAYLGKDTAQIIFDLPSWVVIDSVATTTDVLVQGDFATSVGPLADKPLMVSFDYGSGLVAYTCFHNEAQLTTDARKLLNYFISLLD